jgi:hypothetical protein
MNSGVMDSRVTVAYAAFSRCLTSVHLAGDWGELDEHDACENELSLQNNWRILSAYALSTGVKLWIITEADHITQMDQFAKSRAAAKNSCGLMATNWRIFRNAQFGGRIL